MRDLKDIKRYGLVICPSLVDYYSATDIPDGTRHGPASTVADLCKIAAAEKVAKLDDLLNALDGLGHYQEVMNEIDAANEYQAKVVKSINISSVLPDTALIGYAFCSDEELAALKKSDEGLPYD